MIQKIANFMTGDYKFLNKQIPLHIRLIRGIVEGCFRGFATGYIGYGLVLLIKVLQNMGIEQYSLLILWISGFAYTSIFVGYLGLVCMPLFNVFLVIKEFSEEK